MTDYVAAFAFSEDYTRVALMRKVRPDWQAGQLNGIGGKVEGRELPIEAMVREWGEETNSQPSELDFTLAVILVGRDWRVFFFRAVFDIDDLKAAEDEPIEIHPANRLPTDVLWNLWWLVPLCRDHQLRGPIIVHEQDAPV